MKTRTQNTALFQFQELIGKRVIVQIRREPRKYIGTLVKEDPYFIYLKDAEVLNGKDKMRTPTASVSKHIIGEILELAPQGA